MASVTFAASMRLTVAALVAVLAVAVPQAMAAELVFDVTLTDTAFEPAEIPVSVGMPFKLRFHNASSVAAEVESRDLRFEKVVAAGADAIVNVRPVDAGSYMFFNDFKPQMKGHVVAK